MAATIAPNKALLSAVKLIQDLPVDHADIKYRIMDSASKLIWMAAPWQWSVGVLPISVLTLDTDEVTIGGTGVPSDFLRLIWAGLIDTDQPQDLVIVPALPDASPFKGQPKRITAKTVDTNKFRAFPIPTGYSSAPSLAAVYKKKHTEITSANEATAGALVMDDEYYYVYEALVWYYALLYADDPRAGQQLQMAFAFLQTMRMQEPLVIDYMGAALNG